jgi:hypothetical protein
MEILTGSEKGIRLDSLKEINSVTLKGFPRDSRKLRVK